MSTDPPLTLNGSCAHCGGPRPTKPLKALYERARDADPFCSTECCRAFYGVPAPAGAPAQPRGYMSKLDARVNRV